MPKFRPHFITLRLLAILLLSLSLTPQAFADLQLSQQMPGIPIIGDAVVIEDPNRQLSINDILKKDKTELQQSKHNKSLKGMSSSAWWVMFDITNQTDSNITWVLEAIYTHTDYLDLYYIDNSNGNVTTVLTGDKRPFINRPISSESYAFPFSAAPYSNGTIVLRYAYEEVGLIDLSLRTWDQKSFQHHSSVTYYLYGVLFGAGLFVILFIIIIHIPTRLPQHYWYLGYIILVLVNLLANTGLGHRFVWGSSPYLTDSVHILVTSLAFIFALQFNRVFLQTKQLMPRADFLLKFLLGMAITSCVCYLFGFRDISVKLLLLTALLLGIMPIIGLWAWKVLKRIDARWYVIAWSVWSISMLVFIGRLSGILEVSDFTLWILRMGLLLETVLLGLALIDHVNVLRKEKQASEEMLVLSLKNSNLELEEKVQVRTADLELARQEAVLLAETDELTGIGNRRFFFSRGENAFKLAKRLEKPLTLVMIDIDFFKKVNDSKGHAAGDLVIKHIALLSEQRLRSTDINARIGGEEFAFIMMGTGLDETLVYSEQLRNEIESSDIKSPHGNINVTASFGVASLTPHDQDIETLLNRADQALYQAKRKGRNCIEFL